MIMMLLESLRLLITHPFSGGITAWFMSTIVCFLLLPSTFGFFLALILDDKDVPDWLAPKVLAKFWWKVFSFPFVLVYKVAILLIAGVIVAFRHVRDALR